MDYKVYSKNLTIGDVILAGIVNVFHWRRHNVVWD